MNRLAGNISPKPNVAMLLDPWDVPGIPKWKHWDRDSTVYNLIKLNLTE